MKKCILLLALMAATAQAATTQIKDYQTDDQMRVNPDHSLNVKVLTGGGAAVDYNYGPVGGSTLRTASQIGNATGAADFGSGATSAQTLRGSVNIKREGTDLDYGFGAVGVNTLRNACEMGNGTGAVDFSAGITGAQTLRVSANITRNGTEFSYNAGASDANTPRVAANLKREGNDLSYGYGTVGANTLRVASQPGDASGNLTPAGDTIARGIHTTPGDGTNQVTVKPAATAATASDTSMVTAPFPRENLLTFAGQMFSAALNAAALSGTTETPLLLFTNPNASGKTVAFYSMEFSPTLGNNYVTYRIYRDATVTANGSAVTVTGNRQTGQASTVVSVFSGPTVTANGTLIHHDVASGLTGQDTLWPINFSQLVEANHNILITRTLSANATAGGVDLIWAEQ